MNTEQAKSAVRWFVSTFGGAIAGWFAAKGWFTIDQMTSILTSETTISLIASVAVGIWGLTVHTKSNAVAVVDQIAKEKDSGVKAVIMEPTVAGREIANSMPGNTTVVAGSQAAATIAKA